MKKNMSTTLITILFTCLCITLCVPSLLMAQDVKQLAKEAGNEIRQSQRMMFNGKLDEAAQHVHNAAELLEQIQAADPDFAQLKTLQNKYNKQKKDLDRRLPKEEQAAEPKSEEQPKPAATEKPAEPGFSASSSIY